MTTTGGPAAATRIERELGAWTPGGDAPTLICVAGVHGNEWAGIHAARRVLHSLGSLPGGAGRGRFVAIAGNLAALHRGDPALRYVDHDLNRAFTPERIHRAESAPAGARTVEEGELVGIRESLREHVRPGRTWLIDLHTVSAPSPPFLFLEDSLPAREFALRFRIPMVLGVEEEVSGLLIDHAASEWGVVSLVIEGGQHDDPRAIDLHAAAIWQAILHLGLCAPGVCPAAEAAAETLARASGRRAGHVYEVRHRQPVRSADFRVVPDIRGFDPVFAEASLIAFEGGEPRYPPVSGLVFMPNRQAVRRPGDDAYFIIRRVGRFWLELSARLRRSSLVHALLVLLAPGVRRHPGRAHALVVDPFYAPVFKRELFHLLGYRLVRHPKETHLPVHARLLRAVIGVCASVGALPGRLLRIGRPLPPRDPGEDDWIVARRALDLAGRAGGNVLPAP